MEGSHKAAEMEATEGLNPLKAGTAHAAVASRVSSGPGTLVPTATLLDLTQGMRVPVALQLLG